eukprot:6467771-Pyramimonas_sp.AAC.2
MVRPMRPNMQERAGPESHTRFPVGPGTYHTPHTANRKPHPTTQSLGNTRAKAALVFVASAYLPCDQRGG